MSLENRLSKRRPLSGFVRLIPLSPPVQASILFNRFRHESLSYIIVCCCSLSSPWPAGTYRKVEHACRTGCDQCHRDYVCAEIDDHRLQPLHSIGSVLVIAVLGDELRGLFQPAIVSHTHPYATPDVLAPVANACSGPPSSKFLSFDGTVTLRCLRLQAILAVSVHHLSVFDFESNRLCPIEEAQAGTGAGVTRDEFRVSKNYPRSNGYPTTA